MTTMARAKNNPNPRVTIIVSPRERFEQAVMSLDALFAQTECPFDLVYIDGGSPTEIAEKLEATVRSHGHTYIRHEHFLIPNDARNLGLSHVETEYVAFIDNDVVFESGWLTALVKCADETGAGLVTPTILVGPEQRMPDLSIHHAGGTLKLVPSEEGEELYRRHGFEHERYLSKKGELKRCETDSTEFHVVLARKAMLDEVGGLDPNLCGLSDEIDMAFSAKQGGWKIYFEPASVVAYAVGKRLTWRDIPYFCVRWREKSCLATERYFYDKWGLKPDLDRQVRFLRDHRRHAFPFKKLQRVVGWRMTMAITSVVAETVAIFASRRLVRPLGVADLPA